MSYFIHNEQKIIEVIFANRNKNYGAYALRSNYGYTLLMSVSSVILGVSGLMGLAYYFSNHPSNQKPDHAGQVFNQDSIYVITCKFNEPLPDKAESTKPTLTKSSNSKQALLNTNAIVKDSTKEELTDHELSINTNSSITANNEIGIAGDSTSTITNNKDLITDQKKSGSVIKKDIEVDTPPEFEGGLNALYAIISKNIRYPSEAIEAGVQGTLRINFVVDEKGEIGQLTVLNKTGFGLDDEALRVVSLLPKFKSPAKLKGEAVKVYFQLPIKFSLK